MDFFIKSKCFSAAIHNTNFSNVSRKGQPSLCNWAISAQGTELRPSRPTSCFSFIITDLPYVNHSVDQ